MKTLKQLVLAVLLFNLMSITATAQNGGMKFNGTDNVVDIRTDKSLIETHATHTIEMWVKGNTDTKGVLYTEGWTSSIPRSQYRVVANKGKIQIRYQDYDRKDLVYTNSKTKVFDGKWHHIAIVGNGNNTSLFVDGIKDAANFNYVRPKYWDNLSEGGGDFNRTTIGQIVKSTGDARQTNAKFWYNGSISNLRTWSKALSEKELKNYSEAPSNTEGLLHHITFNEKETSLRDQATGKKVSLKGKTSEATYINR